MNLLALTAFGLYASLLVSAQDPTVVAPNAYRHEFENERVRVTRVRYGPREKVAVHDHPKEATVYVYLRDAGPVRFLHPGEDVIVRPAVRAGGFRLGRAVSETHSVESESESVNEFLRVELKGMEFERNSFRGRFPPDAHRPDRASRAVRFENQKVRITRVTCAARGRCDALERITTPTLLVAVKPARLRTAGQGGGELRLALGETKWVEPGGGARAENVGGAPAEFLLIGLKTAPGRGGR